jgi:chemotaxis protein MotA
MDLATIGGLAVSMLLIWVPIIMAGQVAAFVDIGSIMITIGGSIAAVVASFPLKDSLGVIKVIRKAIFAETFNLTQKIDTLIDLGEKARREGILALERELKGIDDDFMKKSIQLAVDGNEVEVIENVMGTELEYLEARHKNGKAYLEQLGFFAPAFGMIGTLVGSHPDAASPGRSLEHRRRHGRGPHHHFLRLRNGQRDLFTPGNKLAARSSEEMLLKNLILVGILSIQSGDNPRVLRDKLETFIAPALRKGSNN